MRCILHSVSWTVADYRKRRVASTVVTAAGRAFDQDSTDQWVAQDLIPAVFITDGAVSRRFPAFDVVNMWSELNSKSARGNSTHPC